MTEYRCVIVPEPSSGEREKGYTWDKLIEATINQQAKNGYDLVQISPLEKNTDNQARVLIVTRKRAEGYEAFIG